MTLSSMINQLLIFVLIAADLSAGVILVVTV